MKEPKNLKLGLVLPPQEEEDIARFKMTVSDKRDEISIEGAGGKGWMVVGLRVVDGQIHLVRYSHINDDRFATDSKGQIEETEE